MVLRYTRVPFIDIASFNVKYLLMHKVQMHACTISKLLYSLCTCTGDNRSEIVLLSENAFSTDDQTTFRKFDRRSTSKIGNRCTTPSGKVFKKIRCPLAFFENASFGWATSAEQITNSTADFHLRPKSVFIPLQITYLN